jgi:hypothetical protein
MKFVMPLFLLVTGFAFSSAEVLANGGSYQVDSLKVISNRNFYVKENGTLNPYFKNYVAEIEEKFAGYWDRGHLQPEVIS